MGQEQIDYDSKAAQYRAERQEEEEELCLRDYHLGEMLSKPEYWETLNKARLNPTAANIDALCRKMFLEGWSKCVKANVINEE